MKAIERNKLHKALKEGATIHFDNEKFCEEFGSDDFRGGQKKELWYNGIYHSV
jgi:hypothetical protein